MPNNQKKPEMIPEILAEMRNDHGIPVPIPFSDGSQEAIWKFNVDKYVDRIEAALKHYEPKTNKGSNQ